MNGSECTAQISLLQYHTHKKEFTLLEIKEKQEVISWWHVNASIQQLICINLVLNLIENQLFVSSLFDFCIIYPTNAMRVFFSRETMTKYMIDACYHHWDV